MTHGMNELYTKFGELLRLERERQNLKIEDLASDLKISEGNLEALESGNRDDLPSETYFGLFAKSYAEALGIDYSRTMEALREELGVSLEGNGEVKPHGQRTLSDRDQAEITQWMEERRALLAQRDIDDIHRAVDYLNLTTQWAQSKASDTQLEEVTDRLLMAMHDLRTVLVRKKADRLDKD